MFAMLVLIGCGSAAKPASNTASSPSSTEPAPTSDAHDRVFAALRSDGVNPSCVSLEDEDAGVIAVREKHGGGCLGDPQTSPIVRRYRVVDGVLQRYDAASDAWQP